MSRPWLKFYPADWRSDPKLRVCSIAARGLWAEMICIMHEAEPYGHLTVSGKPVSPSQMAVFAGITQRECTKLLTELGGAGVFSTADGVIFSRRMVRDKAKEDKDRENGKGGGNPKLIPEDNVGDNPPVKAQKPEARDQKDDGIVDARAGGQSWITESSKALADAFYGAIGMSDPMTITPEFYGVMHRAVEWERAGWPADLIAAEAKRIGPDKPLGYHEKVFATAYAKRQAPLPVVTVSQPEQINVAGNAARPARGALTAVIDQQLAEARERERGMGGDEGSTRLLSHG